MMELHVGADQGEYVVRQRVEAAHRALARLLGSVREAFRTGGVGPARESFGALREALETHFEQEDSLYYPAIRALRPDTHETLARIAQGHQRFRDTFAAIDARIAEGALDEAAARFEAFAEAYAQHEAVEEALLASIAYVDELPARPGS
jgi:hypothetical protein